MAEDIGAACIVVWMFTAFVGLIQCLLIAELASRYPEKVGGAPSYNHEGLKHLSPLFGAVSAWGYWVGWIPGVAVNLTVAATYVRAAFWPNVNVVGLTLALVVILYALNYRGLRFSVWTSTVMALCALLPLLIIVAAPLFHSALWHGRNFSPLLSHHGTPFSLSTLPLLAKWLFVAVWSSYGAEMVATMVGELRDPEQAIPRAVGLAAAATLLAFTVVPTVLVAIVGPRGMARDPYVVFLTASHEIFGSLGTQIVSLMLIAALILGAQLFIISSSRALHQMSKDGLTIQSFGKLNRHGVPTGSVGWDAIVTLSLLAIFKDDVVNVVAAANVGYLLVFIILPVAYVLVRTRLGGYATFSLPPFMVPIALAILALNVTIFIVGGSQWGPRVITVGLFLVLTFVPFHVHARRRAQ
jgi:amino acid transporter